MAPVFLECHRVLKPGGALLGGFDTEMNFALNEEGTELGNKLPCNPLHDKDLYEESIRQGWGLQFSHTVREMIGRQLEAGFQLAGLYEDTNEGGILRKYNIPAFLATKSIKTERQA